MDQLSTIQVANLGKDVSRDEIIALFGLDKPESIKNSTQINLVHGETTNTAIIEVLQFKYEELLKLNGVTFKGRDFTITGDGISADATHSAETADCGGGEDTGPEVLDTEADAEGEIMYLQLDTRIPEWNFRQVTDLEIVEALEIEFPDDMTKSVEDLGRYKKSLQGIFRVDSADYNPYTGASLSIRDRQIPFTPWRRRPRDTNTPGGPSFRPGRREGTLITIYGAFRIENRTIDNEKFDEAFEALNVEIIKPSLPQLRKGTSTLNNNRYLVVEKLDGKDDLKKRIGSRIKVEGKSFNIVYDGLQKHCWTCMKTHGRDCPIKARNDFLRQQRKVSNKRKIYSTSSLRHANQLALNTDVACMSGGGLGHIVNAIHHDEKHDEIIIAAGTNDLMQTGDLSEFVFTVEKSVEKLRAITEEVSTSLVLPSIPLPTPQLKAKFKFFEETVRRVEKLNVIKPVDIEHAGIHPTENGTKTILKLVDDSFGNEIIVNGAEEADLTRRRYQQVQSLYKVGCKACDSLDLTPNLCVTCQQASTTTDTTALKAMVDKETDEEFPAMETEDEDPKNTNKRPISDDDGTDDHPAKR